MAAKDMRRASTRTRWWQLLCGVLCMVLIANLQYSWTLFVQPMNRAHGWPVAAIQWAFSIFVALETWLTPVAGLIVERLGPVRGPRWVVFFGGFAVAAGWVIDAYATELWMLYLAAAISGLGGGGIYATCVGGAVKWFPDRRGLAVGITAGGFGAGAALTVIPVKMVIAGYGYAAAFFWFGLLQGGLLCVVAFMLRAPARGEVAAATSTPVRQSFVDTRPRQMLATPVFWLLYVMFVAISASGLMATAQLALIAADYHIADTIILFGASTLGVALIVDNVANGAARPLFGWVSDRIGREETMAIAFGCGAVAYLLLVFAGSDPWLFVLLAALIFFTWGEIFSLFPSTCTDTFGPGHATVNTALLYTAKGASALLVPFANVVRDATGGWTSVFVGAAAVNAIVVLLALFVLRPLRARYHGAVGALT